MGGFAAAGRADDGGHLMFGDIQVVVEQGLIVAIKKIQVPDGNFGWSGPDVSDTPADAMAPWSCGSMIGSFSAICMVMTNFFSAPRPVGIGKIHLYSGPRHDNPGPGSAQIPGGRPGVLSGGRLPTGSTCRRYPRWPQSQGCGRRKKKAVKSETRAACCHIMRDDGNGVLRFQFEDQCFDLGGGHGIDGGARFVHEQDFRLDHNGPGDAQAAAAALLTARSPAGERESFTSSQMAAPRKAFSTQSAGLAFAQAIMLLQPKGNIIMKMDMGRG